MDLIDRQAAMAFPLSWDHYDEKNGNAAFICGVECYRDYIKELPSVQPDVHDRNVGKWIYLEGLDVFECSVCGGQMVRNVFDYCPWCGSKMKGEAMDDLISRQAAIDALCEDYCCGHHDCKRYPKCENLRAIQTLPSAQQETSFITWLLDAIWDDEMWELNWQAFPETVCRKLAKLGYLMEKDGEYERLD